MALFPEKKKKSILGIDIGARTTKIAQLKFSGRGSPDLVFCEMLNTGLLDEGFQANMNAFLRDSGFSGSLAALSFDHESLVMKKFEMPKMPEDELIEAFKWNLREHIDSDIETYTIQFSEIKKSDHLDETQKEYMAYAVQREAVQVFKQKIEQLNLSVILIEPKEVTLASALDRCYPDPGHFLAGADIGHQTCKFYVIGKRNFVFNRNLPMVKYDDFFSSPEEYRTKLAIELQKSIDIFQVNFKMEPLQGIYLSGSGAVIENLCEYLQTNLGMQTNLLNPFQTLNPVPSQGEARPELFVQAVSLAYIQP